MTRWSIRPLLAAALLVPVGLAAANPWGIGDGAAPHQAPSADGIQGAPAPVERAGAPDDATRASDAPVPSWSDAARAPAGNGDWRRTGEPSRGPAPDGSTYRFREDVGAADLPAGAAAGTQMGSVPATPAPSYRFRGDPPGLVGVGVPDAGSYRFRPLTERELERQGQGADPGLRPRRAPSAGPGWADERTGHSPPR